MGRSKSSGGSRISPRRGRQLPGGAPTYDFAKFPPKLHEIERIWTPGGGGGARPKFYYVDPPLKSDKNPSLEDKKLTESPSNEDAAIGSTSKQKDKPGKKRGKAKVEREQKENERKKKKKMWNPLKVKMNQLLRIKSKTKFLDLQLSHFMRMKRWWK